MKIENIDHNRSDLPYMSYGFALVEKVEDKYYLATKIETCRGYLGEAIFLTKNPKALYSKDRNFIMLKKMNLSLGPTLVALYMGQNREGLGDERKKIFLYSLGKIHEKEKQAGMKLSKVHETNNPHILVVEGDKRWKNSCWKIMIWTFYLKVFSSATPKSVDGNYWNSLEKRNNAIGEAIQTREDVFLSKAKMAGSKEIFSETVYGEGIRGFGHDYNGFIAIAGGQNPPMAKLLGIK